MQVLLMQLNPIVGDIPGNLHMIQRQIEGYKTQHQKTRDVQPKPCVLVFPELCLTGYPPEDLLLRPSFIKAAAAALQELQSMTQGLPMLLVVVGGPLMLATGVLVNAAFALCDGRIIQTHHKQELPNYSVFDEKRYFMPGSKPLEAFEWHGTRFGLSICEDMWLPKVTQELLQTRAQVILHLNASPFAQDKVQQRIDVLQARLAQAQALGQALTIVYVNQVGAQDELLFDGGSLVVTPTQVLQMPRFAQCVAALDLTQHALQSQALALDVVQQPVSAHSIAQHLYAHPLAEVFQALVLGLADYVRKNGFKQVVLGLSGGIDSALTLAIATAALGPSAVHAVMMPFEFTAPMSIDDAQQQAQALGVHFSIQPIASIYNAIDQSLQSYFEGLPADITQENIQARCRGILLMALSNKFGYLVLTTSNKSEIAVGYSTLYGDMAGGFAVIKDVPKTQVYALSRWINQHSTALGFATSEQIIPTRVIERPASAELRHDQTDQDSLPDYETLDGVLYRYIELDQSADDIISAGYAKELVHDILHKVRLSEHKRHQAPIGTRISAKAFGRDWRYPITAKASYASASYASENRD